MGILSQINNDMRLVFGFDNDAVFYQYTHQDLNKNTSDIFVVIGQTSINCSEMIKTQSCDVLPLEITFGFTLYAKPEVEYNDILDCIDNKILTPLAESFLNLIKINIPQPVYEKQYNRNTVKAEVTLKASYRSTGGLNNV